MKSTDTSFKVALNDLLRQGLSVTRSGRRSLPRYRVKTFSSAFQPGVDPLKLTQLVDELEVEAAKSSPARRCRS